MDDLISGANTIKEVYDFYENAKNCLYEGGFNLRKFNSNSKELEKLVFENYPEDELYSVHQTIKVLGTTWDKSSDVIIYDLNEIRGKFYDNPTKRTVIQSFASI